MQHSSKYDSFLNETRKKEQNYPYVFKMKHMQQIEESNQWNTHDNWVQSTQILNNNTENNVTANDISRQ